MTRILFVNYSNELGGAERSLLTLLKHLSRERLTPLLLTLNDGPLSRHARALGITVMTVHSSIDLSPFRRDKLFRATLKSLRSLPALILLYLKIRRAIQKAAPTLVHSNNPKSHVLCAFACQSLRIPLVLHMRDIFEPATSGYRIMNFIGERFSLPVIAISKAVKAALPPPLTTRATTIYNGFETPTIRMERKRVRDLLGISETEKVVLSAGRLVPWKGHEELIDALTPVLERRICKLIIAGEPFYGAPEYSDHLRKFAIERGLSSQVLFTGHHEDMDSLYAACDLFVLGSRNEPFGRVLVEAMLCGLPVAAYDEAGPREIVDHGETGLLVQPGDEEALASAIEILLSDSSLRVSMGQKAQCAMKERFGINRLTTQVEQLYSALGVFRAQK